MKNFTLLFSCVLLLSIVFTLKSCGILNEVIVEKDDVKMTTRKTLTQQYIVEEIRTPVLNFEKQFFNVIDVNNTFNVKIFDVISLKKEAGFLEENFYLIANGQKFILKAENMAEQRIKEVSNSTENIMKSDSTTVSVITGQNELSYNLVKLQYTLTKEMQDAILTSKEVSFRYYCGVNMITIKITGYELENVKKILAI